MGTFRSPSKNLVMYIIVFAFGIWVAIVERKDWSCPNVFSSKEECGDDKGMPYRGSKPSESDSCHKLLDKIDIAGGTDQNTIKWRRAFVMAIIVVLLLFLLVISPGKLPKWNIFYLGVIVAGLVIYGWLDYYSYHLSKVPAHYIYQSTDMIREKCLGVTTTRPSSP